MSHSENQTIISYLFPILRYHDRWKDISKIDFNNDRYDPYKGQYVVFKNEPADIPNDFMEHVGTASEPVEEVYFYHKKIIDLW